MKFAGTSRLGVLVRLNMSKMNFADTDSVSFVSLTTDMSVRFCHDCRNRLRWPVVKLVSKVSLGGIAPLRSPGLSSGTVKQFACSAGPFTPLRPVYACLAEQPAASGAFGLVMLSLTL